MKHIQNQTETATVTITGYASGGEGIARLDSGKVVFVRGAARGDVLEVEITSEKSGSARAAIKRILSPSPYRVKPDCPYYPDCGGCDFRHITYEEELSAKLRRVNDALSRICGTDKRVDTILRTGRIDAYRNKAVLHSDGKSLGFFKNHSHTVIPIKRCLLLKDDINAALGALPQNVGTASSVSTTPSVGTTLCSGRNGLRTPLEEELDGLVFGISGFFQVNTEAALLLYKKVREYAALTKADTLVDMYCGVGSMTIFAGRDAGYAIGIELDSGAAAIARQNAYRNNMPHVEFINADAGKWDTGGIKADCVIADPPRKGLSREAINKILELSPSRVVYVSCDPATLARDLRLFNGYGIADICAVDMFPRTANVECCCLLRKTPQTFG